MNKMVQVGLLLVMVASVASFREIEFKNCKTATGTLSCKVRSVKVSGCLDPSSWVDTNGSVIEYESGDIKSPCRIDNNSASPKSHNFSITFEPGYPMNTVRSQFTLPDLQECSSIDECPVDTRPEPGCEHTKCPLQPGRQQRYEAALVVNPVVASRPVNSRKIYQLRWKLWNNKDKKHSCCFNIPIQY